MDVAPLPRARLAEAERVLAEACAFDRADVVADEKLFGPGPTSAAQAFGAWHGTRLVGVASVAARWLRLIAVVPGARRQGVGAALLAACEAAARTNAQPKLSVLAQPGNYLAPGVDERNNEALAWLDKRGFERGTELRSNVLIAVRDNPRVTPARLAAAVATAREHGYEVRRAKLDEREALCAAIAAEFGGAWPFEVDRAFGALGARAHVDANTDAMSTAHVGANPDDAMTTAHVGANTDAMSTAHVGANPDDAITTAHVGTNPDVAMSTAHVGANTDARFLAHVGANTDARFPAHVGANPDARFRADVTAVPFAMPGVHVALKDGAFCAFAAHDGNNRGLGWFGPTGTFPAHRGLGLGEALLLACLLDVAAIHTHCEVAWIGPRPFYEKVAGITSERRFVTFTKTL